MRQRKKSVELNKTVKKNVGSKKKKKTVNRNADSLESINYLYLQTRCVALNVSCSNYYDLLTLYA